MASVHGAICEDYAERSVVNYEVIDLDDKRYQVVFYRRFECKGAPPMTWAEAAMDRERLQYAHPENFYVIEEVRR